jgi:hypothetical protein
MEREVLAYLVWKALGLTLHNPRPRELDGDGSSSGGFVMEAAVLARRRPPARLVFQPPMQVLLE